MRRPILPTCALFLAIARAAAASTAADICPPAADPCVVTGAAVVTPGSTLDFGTRALEVHGTGSITVAGGALTILAGSVRVLSHGRIVGGASGGVAGSVSIFTSGDIRVETGGSGDGAIDTSANDSPGDIELAAHGDIVIDGDVDSNSETTSGDGGVIDFTADANVTISGSVRARGGTLGFGGAVTVQAGGAASVPGTVRVDAGDGGDIEIDALNGDITTPGTVNASGGGNIGDGGSIALLASRDLSVGGTLSLGAAGSDLEGGGTGGDVEMEGTVGAVSLAGTIDNHGAAPDGDAGEIDITAGTDYVQTGTITNTGNGGDGCGGFVGLVASGLLDLRGGIDLSGGFCGGDLDGEGTAVSIPAGTEFASDGGVDAGSFAFTARRITAAGRMHANGTTTSARGGFAQLTACTIGVSAGAQIRTDGALGENLLQASGQLTIGGLLSSVPTGRNRFEYRDPGRPPITLGTASIAPTRDCAPAAGCLTPSLIPCATTAVCGNGVREMDEDCDDANLVACDGCSPTCKTEGCGNGTIECGEECDDGVNNGVPGDPCDAACHVVQAANVVYIPGARRGQNGCFLEWAIVNTPAGGFPSMSQSCIDGDPACDQDGAIDGACSFHVTACLNFTDPRLPKCAAQPITFVKLRRPSPVRPSDAVEVANAQQLVSAVEALGVTVRAGRGVLQVGMPDAQPDHCTATFVQRVPHASNATGRRLLSAGATSMTGDRTSNRVVLSCLPNPAVCGNGVVEVGEQCDDANTASCDGCSAACRRERCGDGVIACGEDCDDGLANGTPGASCSARCTEVPPATRIPGGSRSTECIGEWALAGSLVNGRNGLPATKQTCVDGDSTCDFDPTPGTCRFHLWECLGGDDGRLGCTGSAVAAATLVKPSATKQGFAARARAAILTQLGRLPLPAGPGEVCTGRIDVDVPAGRAKLGLKSEATTTDGARDRDALRLTCAPAGP